MDYRKESLKLHEEWRGKIEVTPRVPVDTREHLSLAYTPGVAEPCMAIHADTDKSFMLTRRWNIVPVITDGTAVLGLGDIGPEAGLPVMEGKCALFKAFGGVDAIPLCIRSKDTDEIVRTIELLAGSFGGINLEDISAPRCFEIEKRLKKDLDIPVFHDDQHGTAVVTAAALLNALKIVGKKIEDINVVINGAGAAGLAIAKFLLRFGVKDVIVCDSKGILCKGDSRLNGAKQEVAEMSNKRRVVGSLAAAMKGADVFVGVSVANCVSEEMVRSMAEKAIVFACANPTPEISREKALAAGAAVVGTGSSEYPNQINNVLVFPGLFRGALDVRAKDINMEMMMAAAQGIASCVSETQLNPDYILPYAYDPKAHEAVAKAVAQAARDTGVARE
jgi:malate dehydrogenase (oxaloacetate-decarboxylating)